MSQAEADRRRQFQAKKQTSLETADQMFKDAFLIIKTRFAKQNPQLNDEQLNQVTAKYFKDLN